MVFVRFEFTISLRYEFHVYKTGSLIEFLPRSLSILYSIKIINVPNYFFHISLFRIFSYMCLLRELLQGGVYTFSLHIFVNYSF